MWMRVKSINQNVFLGIQFLPGRIRSACEEVGIPWGHVSSGCIYSGNKSNGEDWSE